MKHILVTGSLAFDYIMDFPGSYSDHILPDKIKTLSVSFLVENLNKNFGGTAGNIAYTLALLQQSTAILASSGKKDFNEYFDRIKKTGVDTSSINIVEDEFTATAYIMTDKNNCQITGFYAGAMNKDVTLSITDVKHPVDLLVISPTIPKAMGNFVKEAKKKSIPYLFDPAQALARLTTEQLHLALEGAEIVIGNDYEIALLIKRTGFSKKQLLEKAKILITTLGEKGSLIETKQETINVGIAKPTKIVDPTGAGDAYIAGFVAGYLQSLALQICGQMGAVAAAYTIGYYGTQKHRFTTKEFNDRYRSTFGAYPNVSE